MTDQTPVATSALGSYWERVEYTLLFLLHMLLRSICHQVSNQADKFDILAFIFYRVYLLELNTV